jgi:mono/diheme cytochrome c family protein
MMRWLAVCVLFALSGCERAMQDMYDQPRYRHMSARPGETPSAAALALPSASVVRAQGELASTSSARAGEAAADETERDDRAVKNPYPVDAALLRRGRERFDVYCVPCHSPLGDGDGVVAQRGFPHPPSYHSARLRSAPDRHFYDVMTNGYGIMYSYADRVTPAERWAIVAYIRALQLSQHASAAKLPQDARAKLDAAVTKAQPR